jgi:hypothetical protein
MELEPDIHLSNISRYSPHLKGNAPVNAVWGKSRRYCDNHTEHVIIPYGENEHTRIYSATNGCLHLFPKRNVSPPTAGMGTNINISSY